MSRKIGAFSSSCAMVPSPGETVFGLSLSGSGNAVSASSSSSEEVRLPLGTMVRGQYIVGDVKFAGCEVLADVISQSSWTIQKSSSLYTYGSMRYQSPLISLM
jgi:hypothetical protein